MERLGKEPNPEKAPVEINHFPFEVQLAFSIHMLLPDRWDGMNGIYLGKDWAALGSLLDIYKVENKQIVVYFIKYIEHYNSEKINDKAQQDKKRAEKLAESKAQQGTKRIQG